MEDRNKVTVKIYGQEYTISGNQPRDHIIKVADYVNAKMFDVAEVLSSGPMSEVAVLAAVNVADDYFNSIALANGLQAKILQSERDQQHRMQLLEDAKKNYIEYKEAAQSSAAQKDDALRRLQEKESELRDLQERFRQLQGENRALLERNEDFTQRLASWETARETTAMSVKELEAKCREMENSFFDLQMENIQLKGELDRYKKIVE